MANLTREIIPIALASAGALACLIIAFLHWGSRHEAGLLSLLLIVLIGLGLTGLLSILADYPHGINWSAVVSLVVVGGLIALALITIMSIGPHVGAVALLFLVATILRNYGSSHGFGLTTGLLLGSALIWFVLLLICSTHVGLDMIDMPAESSAPKLLNPSDYNDSFRVQIGSQDSLAIESVAEAFFISMSPNWLGPRELPDHALAFEQGLVMGGWEVFHKSKHEIVVGLNRSFIDLRLSLMLDEKDGRRLITATTVARYNNWQGVLYFVPVRYGHQIVLADTMRRLKTMLERAK